MSRSLVFVLAGSIWTVASTATVAYLDFPPGHLAASALVLAGCLALTSLLYSAAALAQSVLGRHLATILHLSVPLAWVTWLELSSQTWLHAQQWILFAGCAFFGAALADHGVMSDQAARTTSDSPSPRASAADESGGFRLGPLTAFDSGGFSVSQLSACDSGSFRIP